VSVKGDITPIQAELTQRRHALGLSQQTVAERAGLTQTYLSKIERGKLDPRLTTLQEIARAVSAEPVLVPLDLLPSIRALLGHTATVEERPLFAAEPD
jgi:transcriptional regulator with XRE-family HTH domain